MKDFKKVISILLSLSLLIALSGCSAVGGSIHPPKYETLYSMLALPMDTLLTELNLTKEQLTKTSPGLYQTPLKVDFHDVPFTISIQSDIYNDYLYGFIYTADFGSDITAFSEAVCEIAKVMTESFGASTTLAGIPTPEPFTNMTATEITSKFAAFDPSNPETGWAHNNNWLLEELKGEKMESYLPLLQVHDAKKFSQTPTLVVTLSAYNTTRGTYELAISYSIKFPG